MEELEVSEHGRLPRCRASSASARLLREHELARWCSRQRSRRKGNTSVGSKLTSPRRRRMRRHLRLRQPKSLRHDPVQRDVPPVCGTCAKGGLGGCAARAARGKPAHRPLIMCTGAMCVAAESNTGALPCIVL